MTIDLYYMPGSAPCNAVILAAKVLGVELNLKVCNLEKQEQMTPEYIKLNPTHTIPTLVDEDGFSVWESRNIIVYLATKYGKAGQAEALFPTDVKKRSVVLQRLFFDVSTLYQRFADYYYPQLFAQQPADPKLLDRIHLGLEFLEGFLTNSKWVTGDDLTVADLSILATIFAYRGADFDLSKYPNIERFFAQGKEVAGFAEVEQNMLEWVKYFDVLKK